MWKAVIFVIATAALLYVSRASLRKPRSHGFFRFFAWEVMLLLFLLNVTAWFDDWRAWHQVISWVLLCVSILPLALGIRALRTSGRPDEHERREPQLLAFERTTQLVTDGIYKYIRHPLYSSLLILNWGMFFKDPTWLGAALAVAASGFLLATARSDEAECMQVFGMEYQRYRQHTRMFIPFVL